MNLSDELRKLQELHQSGALSDDEFARAKASLLAEPHPSAPPPPPAPVADAAPRLPQTREQEVRQWSMFVHLSQLAGYFAPVAGFIAPIVIWQLKRKELPELDVHARIVVNWLITALIYAVVCVVLSMLCIGLPLLVALGIVGIVFPIIGGLKANDGETWEYPLSIRWLK